MGPRQETDQTPKKPRRAWHAQSSRSKQAEILKGVSVLCSALLFLRKIESSRTAILRLRGDALRWLRSEESNLAGDVREIGGFCCASSRVAAPRCRWRPPSYLTPAWASGRLCDFGAAARASSEETDRWITPRPARTNRRTLRITNSFRWSQCWRTRSWMPPCKHIHLVVMFAGDGTFPSFCRAQM